jgi:hypothetical protein
MSCHVPPSEAKHRPTSIRSAHTVVESHDHCQAARTQERSEQAAIDAATPLNLLADPGIPHPVTVLCDDSEGDADEEGCASRSYFPVGWPTAASAVVQFATMARCINLARTREHGWPPPTQPGRRGNGGGVRLVLPRSSRVMRRSPHPRYGALPIPGGPRPSTLLPSTTAERGWEEAGACPRT